MHLTWHEALNHFKVQCMIQNKNFKRRSCIMREQQSAYMCIYVYTIMCILSLNSKIDLTILSVSSLLWYLKWSIGTDHVLLQLLMHRKFCLRMCTLLLLLCDSFCTRPFIYTYSVIEEEKQLKSSDRRKVVFLIGELRYF